MRRRGSWPNSADIFRRTSRTSSITGSGCIVFLSGQFKRCHQLGHMQPQKGIHHSNMSDLIRICQMVAIPSQKIVALVNRRERKMHRITRRVTRHYISCNINFDRAKDGFRLRQDANGFHQLELFLFSQMISARKFVYYGQASHQQILPAAVIPPIASPFTTSNGFSVRPLIEIETRNGCFNINCFHNQTSNLPASRVRGFIHDFPLVNDFVDKRVSPTKSFGNIRWRAH